jgi:hypothetical protein
VPALWFADEVELLVFLARRAHAGDTAAWWWPALAGAVAEPRAAVAAAWQGQAHAVPAAVSALGDEALVVCKELGAPACEAVALAVARTFRVPGWGRVGPATPGAQALGVFGVHPDKRGSAAAAATADATAAAAAAAAAARAAEPRPVRPDHGGRGASAPVAEPHAVAREPVPPTAASRLVALARVLAREPWSATAPSLRGRVDREAVALAGPRATSSPGAIGSERLAAPAGPGALTLLAPSPSSGPPAAGTPFCEARGSRPPRADRPPGKGRADAPAPPVPAWPPTRCITPHAGLFFLVPLLQRQACIGDFTQPAPADPASHPAWLLLALLRRLGDRRLADRLPALLMAWAGPGRRPRGAVPPRPALGALVRALQFDAGRRLDRPPRGALAWLVRQPGWARLGPARLDVGFSLDRHPFAIRASGLDRDIGWLPAGGRHLAFHFDTHWPPAGAWT